MITDVTLASSETQRGAIWNIREDVGQPRLVTPLLTFDVSLPIENMKAYVEEVEAAVTQSPARTGLSCSGTWRTAICTSSLPRATTRPRARRWKRWCIGRSRPRRIRVRGTWHRPREAALARPLPQSG